MMLFRMSPAKFRKIKALLLLAILSVSEGRRLSSNIHAGTYFEFGGSAQNGESPIHGRYDGTKHMTTPTAAVRALQAAMEDPKLQKHSELLAEAIAALATEPKMHEFYGFVTEATEKLRENRYIQEHGKLGSEQLSAIMDNTRLWQQSKLFVEQLEAMMTEPNVKDQDLQGRVEVLSESLKAITETPGFEKSSTLVAEHIHSIMEHPEVQEWAKLASDKLRAMTEDEDVVERVELASQQWKAIMEHPVLRKLSETLAQQIETMMIEQAPLMEAINRAQTQVTKAEASSFVDVSGKLVTRKFVPLHASLRGPGTKVTTLPSKARHPQPVLGGLPRARAAHMSMSIPFGRRGGYQGISVSPEQVQSSCRILGVMEDATTLELDRAYQNVLQKYPGDETKKAAAETAKEVIFRSRLEGRMSGKLQASKAASSSWIRDNRPVEREPLIKIPAFLSGVMEFPTRSYLLQNLLLFGLLGLLSPFPEFAPSLIALGFGCGLFRLYQRGAPEAPAGDEFADMRPVKKRPFLLALGMTTLAGFLGALLSPIVSRLVGLAPYRVVAACTAFMYFLSATYFKVQDED